MFITAVCVLTLLFSNVVVVSDLNKNFGGSTDLAKKRHGSADLHAPIHSPPLSTPPRLRPAPLFPYSDFFCSCFSSLYEFSGLT